MSAMLNFLSDLRACIRSTMQLNTIEHNLTIFPAPIISRADVPDLHIPAIRSKSPALSFQENADKSSRPASPVRGKSPQDPISSYPHAHSQMDPSSEDLLLPQNTQSNNASRPVEDSSATEAEDDDEDILPALPSNNKGKARASPLPSSPIPAISPPSKRAGTTASRQLSPEPEPIPPKTVPAQAPSSASDSSPIRPAKKTKRAQASSSSDDDSEAERRRRIARLKSGSSRGAKQPIKRGGKRF